MSKLIIAQGPARTGKTYAGTRWVQEQPDNRLMLDGEVEVAIKLLDRGRDIWLNLNTEGIPVKLLPENLPGHSVEVRKFTRVWP